MATPEIPPPPKTPSPTPPRLSMLEPHVQLAAIRSTMWQHLVALGIVAMATVLFRDEINFWHPVGAAAGIIGVIQLPAILGKGPSGTLSVLQIAAMGSPFLRALANKMHLLG